MYEIIYFLYWFVIGVVLWLFFERRFKELETRVNNYLDDVSGTLTSLMEIIEDRFSEVFDALEGLQIAEVE